MTEGINQSVREAMAKCGWSAGKPGCWTTKLMNGKALPVSARLDDEWLRVDAEVPGPFADSWWRMLVSSRSLPPPVRFAAAYADSGAMCVWLVADLAAQNSGEWSSQVAEVGRAFLEASSRVHAPSFDGNDAPQVEAAVPEAVIEAVRGAGWTCAGHAGGLRVFAPLLRRVRFQAEECGEASAYFLLRTAHRVRAVRAVAREESGVAEFVVGWETWLRLNPDAEELERGLAALTVACRHSRRELAALSDPALARRYLSQQDATPMRRASFTEAPTSR